MLIMDSDTPILGPHALLSKPFGLVYLLSQLLVCSTRYFISFIAFLPVYRFYLPTSAQPYWGTDAKLFRDLARGLKLSPLHYSHGVLPLCYGSHHSLRTSALVPPVMLFGGRSLACGKKTKFRLLMVWSLWFVFFDPCLIDLLCEPHSYNFKSLLTCPKYLGNTLVVSQGQLLIVISSTLRQT